MKGVDMDKELMKKLVLVMMNETSWEDKEVKFKAVLSWKGYPFILINELEEEGMLQQTKKSKYVYLTDEGIKTAGEYAKNLFYTEG